jgi:hypothetical protein
MPELFALRSSKSDLNQGVFPGKSFFIDPRDCGWDKKRMKNHSKAFL